jgi:hypothetical protein
MLVMVVVLAAAVTVDVSVSARWLSLKKEEPRSNTP